MAAEKGFRKLKVWEKAHRLAVDIYTISKGFPKEELFGLTSQIRRAAFSVSLNIVEGHASNSKREFLSFLNISNRSLVETEYSLEIVKELGFLSVKDFQKLDIQRNEVGIMLHAFRKSVMEKQGQV